MPKAEDTQDGERIRPVFSLSRPHRYSLAVLLLCVAVYNRTPNL